MKSLRRETKKHFGLTKKSWIITGVSAIAVLLVVSGGWYAWQRQQSRVAPATTTDPTEQAPVKTQTPAESLAQPSEVSESPSKNESPVPTPPADGTNKKQATPVISYAGYADASKQQVEVDAFVPSIVEEGGTCAMTATKEGKTVTAQSNGHANVSQTRCDNIIVDRSQFPSGGTWNVVVSYNSASAQGQSAVQKMEL